MLFIIGSACFAVGSLPGSRRNPAAPSARPGPRRIDWWATSVQLAGTLFFNVTTFTALDASLSAKGADLVVWTPDALGSICFLVASELAFAEAGHAWFSWRPSDMGWTIAALNLIGSVFFGISAIAGWVQPSTGDLLDAALDTSGTFWGAVCFLAGAVLLLFPERAPAPAVTGDAGLAGAPAQRGR